MDFDVFQEATICALMRLAESRERSTGAHIERTSSLCKLMCELICEAGIHQEEVDRTYVDGMSLVSPLHDIGKVGIPDDILLKPGKLSDEEFEVMKTHVDIGLTTLNSITEIIPEDYLLNLGIDVIKYHHEKWDGRGYPVGLKATEIPLAGRIMAIVDVYEALRSERCYKEAFSHDRSCDIIVEDKGTHFDPQLVDLFITKHEDFEQVYDSPKVNTQQ
ncbi:MAG: HD domain-containing protein [Eubacteriales bacterium]|nr:HD domain-containing protein [Eubacteriales bacterium]MDD4541355.1 HD domain-containing protein [Eubacteriales bacterium]